MFKWLKDIGEGCFRAVAVSKACPLPVQLCPPGTEPGEEGCIGVKNCDGETLAVTFDPSLIPQGIEVSMAGGFGCTFDAEGNVTGNVFLCKTTDEETGETTLRSVLYSIDGTITDPYGGEWQPCETDKGCTSHIFETRVDRAWMDNHTFPNRPTGPVVYPWDDHDVTVDFSDGSACTVSVPGNTLTGGPAYVQWNVDFAALLTAKIDKPWARFVGPADDNDDSTPFFNSVAAECCPGDPVPIAATAVRTNKTPRTVAMAVGVIQGEAEKVIACACCDGPVEWKNAAGETIEQPPCLYPCGQPPAIATPAEPACELQIIGPLCDVDAEPATATEADVVRSDVYYHGALCPDGTFNVEIVADDGTGNQTTYVPVGYLGNCDTLAPVAPPVRPCTIDDAVTLKVVSGCETAFQVTEGRPINSVPWELVGPNGVEVSGVTYADFAANMASAGYSEWINGEAHWFCPCPAGAIGQPQGTYYVTTDGDVTVKIECVDAAKVEGAPEVVEACVVNTDGCNDDRRDDALATLVEKACADQRIGCLTCYLLPYVPGAEIAAPVVGTIGGAGQPIPTPGAPFATIEAFAAALAGEGYNVTLNAGNIEVCAPPSLDPVIGYVLADDTVVTAVGTKELEGLLVCDPGTAALSADLAALIELGNQQLDKLCKLVDILSCDDTACPDLFLTGPTSNGAGWDWNTTNGQVSGKPPGPASFPTNTTGDQWNDIETIVSVPLPEGCDPNALATVCMTIVQSVEGDGHRGAFVTLAGGSLVSQTNNGWPGTLGSAGTTIGKPAGPDELNATRQVCWTIPAGLLAAGARLSTGFLGGANDTIDEWWEEPTLELVEIAGCCPSQSTAREEEEGK